MNKIDQLFSEKKKNVLSIYFTAGFPALNDTNKILAELGNAGVDMIEIGMPFSDPLADGPVIQHSSEVALKNGMSLKVLFEQLKTLPTANFSLPTILMGYLNPVLQFGVEEFCKQAQACGISGLILPDLPLQEYVDEYKSIFEKYGLKNIFLITPQTSEERIRLIDQHSNGFIYVVASSSTTGVKNGTDPSQQKYFERIKKMELKNPLLIGFGISDKKTFENACSYANGAIIGSAFIKVMEEKKSINEFIRSIR